MSKEYLEEMSSFFNQRADIYDSHMLDDLSLSEFYSELEKCLDAKNGPVQILDLGCGTGLELESVFRLYNHAKVTAIDISEKMLDKLKERFIDKLDNLSIICGSYFDVDFGAGVFDAALSTYSLHHFSPGKKLELYKKIYQSIKPGGRFINGDYTVNDLEKEKFYNEESIRLRKEKGVEDGFYHYDTPLAIETEISLLKEAGFSSVLIQKQWENTTILVCCKN